MKKISLIFLSSILLVLVSFVTPVYAIVDNNPGLAELSTNVGELNPKFDYLTTKYILVVGEEVEQIDVVAKPMNGNAKVTVEGNTNLQMGLNTIRIIVTAEDGATRRIYTIYVTKGNVEKANTNLKQLQIENYQLIPEFNNTTTEYLIKVKEDTKQVAITAVPESEKATVEIVGVDNLDRNDNLVKVIITAEDGITKKENHIIVTKGEDELLIEDKQETPKEKAGQANTPIDIVKYILLGIAIIFIVIVIILSIRKHQTKVKEKRESKDEEN